MVNISNFPGGTKYYKNSSNFPEETKYYYKNRSNFPEIKSCAILSKNSSKGEEHLKVCCAIFARKAPIFQEGIFKFSQEHLRFSRRTYPQEQLF